jgi:hypothetical protein
MCLPETKQQHLLLSVLSASAGAMTLSEAWDEMTKVSVKEYGTELTAVTPLSPARLFNEAAADGLIVKASPHRWIISDRGREEKKDIEVLFLAPVAA